MGHSEAIVTQHQANNSFDEFKLDLIRYLGIESPVDEKSFMQTKPDKRITQIFESAHDHYRAKSKMIAEKSFPVVNDIFTHQGQTIENIVVPFSDGLRNIQVVANLKRAFETRGMELISAFERTVTLALIDDAWKEHLREMDDLKTSVQNAVYEQKDPLLIYKFESFELFKQMLEKVNKDILSFLFKSYIAVQRSANVREARPPQRTDMSNAFACICLDGRTLESGAVVVAV